MEREPEPLQTTPPVDRVIRTCLAKDPDERFQTARDAKKVLLWAVEGAATAPSQSRFGKGGWVAAGVLAVVAAALSFVHFREVAPQPPSYAYTIPPPPNSVINSFAISPDGRTVAIAALANGKTSLRVRALDSFGLRELAGTDGASQPFWSPDGRSIGFAAGAVIKTISAAGGPATSLAGMIGALPGASWHPDGTILSSGPGGSIQRQNPSGGDPVKVLESPFPLAYPWVLPDGKRFLYSNFQGPEETRGIYVGSLDSRETRRLIPDARSGIYAPPWPGTSAGHILYGRDGSLVAQPVDGATLLPAGKVMTIAEQANPRNGTFSVSATGALLYQNEQRILTRLAFMDRAGKELMAVGEPASIYDFGLSPDEKHIVISQTTSTNQADL
jgi:hypothetical protein